MNPKRLAQKHSTSCFLNSLFREWSGYIYDAEEKSFVIHLTKDEDLVVPVIYYSLVGRHDYAQEFYLFKNQTKETIDFNQLIKKLLKHLSSIYKTNSEQLSIFSERIINSLNNIEMSLGLRENDILKLYNNEFITFKDAEQGLILGHTFHPHPKNRDEFNNLDFKLYSPESAGEFNLHWFMIHSDIIFSCLSKSFEHKNWNEEVFLKEMPLSKNYNELKTAGYEAFPIHPWQKDILLNMSIIKDYISEGLIIDMGASLVASQKWFPTSSLRTLSNEFSDYMLKFSMSVRLTNSVRHLLPLEVVRGLQVFDVFQTKTGTKFLSQYPQFNILFEPAFMSITDRNKKIINETIVALRLNSFKNNSTQKLVLATLTQDNPYGGESLIGHQIKRKVENTNRNISDIAIEWFESYLAVAVKPLIMAQANYGILLGAHQQNLILEITDNMPTASYFRDCQGTGYSKTGFEIFSKSVELMTLENGNVLDDEMGNTLFSYYLIINSTFNVINTIAKDTGLSEEHLMKVLKTNLNNWQAEDIKDNACFKYLLESPKLFQKGNFLCSFINMNENTTENPLGIYNSFSNPIFETIL